jgi:hypothetical protein
MAVSEALEILARAIATGVIATALLDLFNLAQKRILNAPTPDWGLVGRWIGHMPQGRFVHDSIGKAPPIPGERAIGWIAHYAIGVAFATIAILAFGVGWARQPTFLPAFIVGIVGVIAPYFMLQPGMGMGIAASKAPNPTLARIRSLITHTVFGVSLYVAARIVAAIW